MIFFKKNKKNYSYFKKKIFLSNGDDLKIIKMNYKRFIKKIGINVKFINLRKILVILILNFISKKEKSKELIMR